MELDRLWLADFDPAVTWIAARPMSQHPLRVRRGCTPAAYTVGYEVSDVALDGAPIAHQRLRVTQIYRREDGEWRLVHRHGDFVPTDQSPP